MLLDLQYAVPNQTIETVEGEQIRIFKIDLEDWREIEKMNANS